MHEPELLPIDGSEIQAAVDFGAVGLDGQARPILIHQDDTDFLGLTLADARRLLKFLTEAVVYVEEYNSRITQ